jgi:heme-degrading monooxygenase HmoA
VSYVIVFRSRLRPGVEAAYGTRAEEIYDLAVQMPGLLSSKDFVAEDGERLTIVEFDTAEHLAAWRDHVEHRKAQAEGRERYYTTYQIQICKVERGSTFDTATGRREI